MWLQSCQSSREKLNIVHLLKETEMFVRNEGSVYKIYLSIGDYIFCSGSKATELNVYYVLLLMKVGLHARPIGFTHRHFLL